MEFELKKTEHQLDLPYIGSTMESYIYIVAIIQGSMAPPSHSLHGQLAWVWEAGCHRFGKCCRNCSISVSKLKVHLTPPCMCKHSGNYSVAPPTRKNRPHLYRPIHSIMYQLIHRMLVASHRPRFMRKRHCKIPTDSPWIGGGEIKYLRMVSQISR